ncbi:MAG: hypothetical protein A49_14100 [Methyloceanibacter sp.]|nr:MAG: hypothetical protein A49_14100 [Methyloceanibacter sp.]
MKEGTREILPQRRRCETFTFKHDNIVYTASIGYYDDACTRPGEVFLDACKTGTAINVFVRDSAIAISFALQCGTTVEQIRSAFTRDAEGRPEGPLGALMDVLAERAGRVAGAT